MKKKIHWNQDLQKVVPYLFLCETDASYNVPTYNLKASREPRVLRHVCEILESRL